MTTEKDNEQLIKAAYLEVLGRPVDDDGKKTHLNAMKHRSIDEIKQVLRRSPEYRDAYKAIVDGKIGKDVAYIGGDGKIIWASSHVSAALSASVEPSSTSTLQKANQKSVMLVSTWGIKCGIATYTAHLLNNINKAEDVAKILPINNRDSSYSIDAGIVHIQHEFGIMPAKFNTDSPVIITFHTVPKNMSKILGHFEYNYDVVGYITHFKEAKDIISGETEKEVWMIPHGSKVIPCAANVRIKECAREWLDFNKLGVKYGEDCAFMFGFQSGNKNADRLMNACKNAGIKLIISGGKHQCGFSNININGMHSSNVIFLNRFLNDVETDLFALACDILLFDYVPQDHYSCSGALHRVIGAGKPIICTRTNHFTDVEENVHCLKFEDQAELELKIKEGLERRDELGRNAYNYSLNTSWENAARQHLEIYRRFLK